MKYGLIFSCFLVFVFREKANELWDALRDLEEIKYDHCERLKRQRYEVSEDVLQHILHLHMFMLSDWVCRNIQIEVLLYQWFHDDSTQSCITTRSSKGYKKKKICWETSPRVGRFFPFISCLVHQQWHTWCDVSLDDALHNLLFLHANVFVFFVGYSLLLLKKRDKPHIFSGSLNSSTEI